MKHILNGFVFLPLAPKTVISGPDIIRKIKIGCHYMKLYIDFFGAVGM